MSTIRLNKLLATRGIGARRKCDQLIESGAVRVNGEVVTAPGARVVEGRDRISVNGKPIPERTVHRYLMLHKPVGVITTMHDPEGRRSIAELIPREGRLYPVGRLDADTSGLLIVTNDGDLAHHLMHPRYGLTKFYRVLLARDVTEQQLARLAAGVEFEPGVRSAPARVRRRDPVPRGAVIEIALHEGRHRQVRRMCEAVGLTVLGLHRWAYGPLKLGELARGIYRELSEAEVAALRGASARPRPRPEGAGTPPRERRVFTRPRPQPLTGDGGPQRREPHVERGRDSRPDGAPPGRADRGASHRPSARPEHGPRRARFERPTTRERRPQGRSSRPDPRRERRPAVGPAGSRARNRSFRREDRAPFQRDARRPGDRPFRREGPSERGRSFSPRGEWRGESRPRPERTAGRAGGFGASRSGTQRSGPPRGKFGAPRSGPPRSGPPRGKFGAPRSGAPRSGPPRSGPPRSGPPRGKFGASRSGPPRGKFGAPRSGAPRSGSPRSGPPRSGPPRGRTNSQRARSAPSDQRRDRPRGPSRRRRRDES